MQSKPHTASLEVSSPTPIRMPADLKAWLQHAAIDNRRSLSGEIVFRLEQSRNLQRKENATD